MLRLPTSLGPVRILQSIDELPRIKGAKFLYADVETTSLGKHNSPAIHPYLGDRVCGWAITWDDEEGAWYIPIRHSDTSWNLPLAPVIEWLKDVLSDVKLEWRNANIKFDAHFAKVDGIQFKCRLGCTTTRAKLIDSERISHGLKSLSRDWLGLKMSEEIEVSRYLEAVPMEGKQTCNDYGRVPADILGRYAGMDVLSNRSLEKYILDRLPAEQSALLEQETLLTPVLWDMEERGLLIDQRRVKIEKAVCLRHIIDAQMLVDDELGCELVDSNKCMQDIMLTQLGLPILAWGKKTKEGTRHPSFDKDTMLLYSGHPLVVTDPRALRVVEAVKDFRTQSRFLALFIAAFESKLDSNGRIHPIYNQCVRTGRMSCKDPNSQQMNTRAKRMVIPGEGRSFLSADASQAEFRTIVHVIKDGDAIDAFQKDIRTDFHSWVAELCKIGRKPAKTMNFLMAFGGGKRRATKELMSNETILEEMMEKWDTLFKQGKVATEDRGKVLEGLCEQRAIEVWDSYHTNLPGIRVTSASAQNIVRQFGYIKNMYNRRRNLSSRFAYKAFNTYVQSSTADMIKERMIALSPRYNSWTRGLDLQEAANVHDENLSDGPTEVAFDPKVQAEVNRILSDVQVPHTVPYTWDTNASDKNWAEAKA